MKVFCSLILTYASFLPDLISPLGIYMLVRNLKKLEIQNDWGNLSHCNRRQRRPLDGVPALLKLHTMLAVKKAPWPLLALIQYLWRTKGDKGTLLWERSFMANCISTAVKSLEAGIGKKIQRVMIYSKTSDNFI